MNNLKNLILTDNGKRRSEQIMLSIVLLNVAVIFLQECGMTSIVLNITDIICSVIFIVEMVLKQCVVGIGYWKNKWDVLDGIVTIISLPALLTYFSPNIENFGFVVAFRALRVLKVLRAARFSKNIDSILKGFKLALRESAAFIVGYLVVIIVVAMFNCALFNKAAPEYFDTPLDGIYSVFRMFTVEGWYDIPNAVVHNMPHTWIHVVRTYFCLLLLGGGIIGMSLINSIFVDAMAADNNDEVLKKLDTLERKLNQMQREMKKCKRKD